VPVASRVAVARTSERVAMLRSPWTADRLAVPAAAALGKLDRRSCGEATQAGRRIRRVMGQFDVLLARLLFPCSLIVLDMLLFAADTARDRGVRTGARLKVLDALDRLATRCASIVLVDTDEDLELIAAGDRRKALVIPVGGGRSLVPGHATDHRRIAAAPDLLRPAHPAAGGTGDRRRHRCTRS